MTRSTNIPRWCLYAQGAGTALVAIGLAILAIGTADDIGTYGYPALQGATVHGLVVQAISAGLLGVCFFVTGRELPRSARWRRFALCCECLVLIAFCAAAPVWLTSGDVSAIAVWLAGVGLAVAAAISLLRIEPVRSARSTRV